MTTTALTVCPLPQSPTHTAAPKQIDLLAWNAPFKWLKLGWGDMKTHFGVSQFYGLPLLCMALVLHWVFDTEPEYAMTVASACLLLGPFVAMGLYDLSRRREHGLVPDFMGSLTCWKQHLGSMGMLVGVLLVLSLLWGRASLIVTALFFNANMPADFDVMNAAFNADNWEFLMAYAVVGGAFALLAFSLSVVSVPMILDRGLDAITAGITSLEVMSENTAVMLLWAAIIVVLVGVSVMLPLALGLVVVGPLLGHASWHAYRNSVRWQ